MSLRQDHRAQARLASKSVGGGSRPTAEDSNYLLRLQQFAGNRAVTALLGGPGVLQRENGTTEEKRKRFKETRREDETSTEKGERLQGARAAFADNQLRTALARIRAGAITESALRTVLGPVWDKWAALNKKDAKDKCEVAAEDIDHRLKNLGIKGEWVGVAGWGPTGTGSLNHYAIVVQELVIDATGQQFVGGMASITPWSEWLSQLESRIPPPLLARYVRGGKGQAQGLAADRDATYFSTDGQGKPLHEYDAKDIAKRKEDLAKRTARVSSRESDEDETPRLKIKGRTKGRSDESE